MADFTVSTTIDSFMQASDSSEAKTVLNITDGIAIAVTGPTTALTASDTTPLDSFHMPNAGELTEVLIGVNIAPVGSTLTCDVHKNGTSIFSTKPTIDANEKTSVTAATAAVISDATFAKGDFIELFCDSVGATTEGAGLKFYFKEA